MAYGGDLHILEDALGYTFVDRDLLMQALTHSSYANELGTPFGSNERLEFLGDAVLQLFVSDMLFKADADMSEGRLTARRVDLVCEGSLAKLARILDLGEHLMLGVVERQDAGHEKDSILADAFEAVIGAVYLDGGSDKVQGVVNDLFEQNQLEMRFENFKGELNEFLAQTSGQFPKYEIIEESGKDHCKEFSAAVYHMGKQLGTGVGQTKKAAEQQAAKAALSKIKG